MYMREYMYFNVYVHGNFYSSMGLYLYSFVYICINLCIYSIVSSRIPCIFGLYVVYLCIIVSCEFAL